jgi:F-type H+-transporting ATPase subunit gamma
MAAMQQATKNADEKLDGLVLERNRLRQAIITKELAEIVGGAEALK